jgi:predicted AlkP superfamily pyrophosphatase or phosphodiesterase
MGARRVLLRLALGALLALALALPAAAKPVVIVLSLDGVRHDYLVRKGLPNFARVAAGGARADALIPVFPSLTFPNHVSLATGARTDRHGIVANHFIDPELGEFDYGNDARFLDAEPIWAAAERQGVRAATFFWVGSETDWRGVGATYRMAPFDTKVQEREKVKQILAWLGLPESERPGLILCWWHGADHAGHRYGPDAPETAQALRAQDRELGRLLDGIEARGGWNEVTLVVVSDHGMSAPGEVVDARERLAAAGIRARVFQGGALAHVYLKRPADADRAVQTLAAVPGVEAWRRDAVPERLRYRSPRNGDVVALAAPPLALLDGGRGGLRGWWQGVVGGARGGVHGYDPEASPEMRAIFLARGRGVPAGARLGVVRTIDVAPTVARLLGIAPPAQAEGEPIAVIGAGLTSGD